MKELKCCPFCGNDVRWCGENNPDSSDDHECHEIHCDNCGTQFGVEGNIADSRTNIDELRALVKLTWNTRLP